MQFKREGDGCWSWGQKRTVVELGSRWAFDPRTFRWGYICFGEGNKVIGEKLVSVAQPKPDVTTLPDTGFKWSEQWAVHMKCLDGTDAGLEVDFKPTTDGGIKAVAGLIETLRDRLNGGAHDGKIVPIALLEKDSYPHPQHGKVWIPVLNNVGWMSLDGNPAPAPAPTPPAAPPTNDNQPRRRRVG
jgi:hypothetical protein